MKILEIIFTSYLAIGMTNCSSHKVVMPDNVTGGLVGLSLILHQNSSPGLAGYLESIDDITAKGVNLYGMAPEWQELEPSPGMFSLQEPIVNPLTLIDPGKGKFKSYILVLKMIDSNRKTVPGDLATNSFSDPLVIGRFKSLIDKLAMLTSIDRVSHILIGNEVDGYLASNPSELSAFATFFQQVVNHIHTKITTAKVGTIITFNSVKDNPAIFNTLTPYSDFICYTYYPTDNSNPNWQMRPPADVFSDIAFMKEKAGNKPFAFTEIGYPSSAENNSSEILQKEFVENMFDALRSSKDERKLEFIFYHSMYDYPTSSCGPYAQAQGIDSTYLCGFMNNLGLNSYSTGQPKQAWFSFCEKMRNW